MGSSCFFPRRRRRGLDAPLSTCIPPPKKFLYGADRAGIGGNISRKRRDVPVEFAALHNIEHALHRLRFQKSALADKEIILRQHPDEIEAKLSSRGLDAETRIRHAAGD